MVVSWTVVNPNALEMYLFHKYLWDEPQKKKHSVYMRCDTLTTVYMITKILQSVCNSELTDAAADVASAVFPLQIASLMMRVHFYSGMHLGPRWRLSNL